MLNFLASLSPFILAQGGGVFLLGLALGSFSSVLIHRIPEGKSWWRGQIRSQCTNCKKTLAARDLIPLYSWLKSRGKCRFCKQKISPLYPILELSTALASLLAYIVLGLDIHALLVIASIPFLIAAFVIDFRAMILPNQLTLIVGVLAFIDIVAKTMQSPQGLLYDVFHIAAPRIAAGAIFCLFAYLLSVITKWITKRDSLGMGDIKFFVVVGLWLGIAPLSAFAVLSGTLGILSPLLLRVLNKNKGNEGLFPFGPSLILSLYILLLFQGSHFM